MQSGTYPFVAVVSSYANYYAYGMLQPDRSWEGGEWRYGFNGKERDDEWGGKGNVYDYGMRMYSAKLGRFAARDPLTSWFASLSPYSYASSTPVAAVDLDGLEAFVVHGTTQSGRGLDLPADVLHEIMRIGGNTKSNLTFRWSNDGQFNSSADRAEAGRRLAAHILAVRSYLLQTHQITPDEPITITGFSHGGNVALQAVPYLVDAGYEVNLITISTPVFAASVSATGEREVESLIERGINMHYQFVHAEDLVAAVAPQDPGSLVTAMSRQTVPENDGWNKGRVSNYVLTDDDVSVGDLFHPIESHTEMYKRAKFAQYLKSVPSMSHPRRSNHRKDETDQNAPMPNPLNPTPREPTQ